MYVEINLLGCPKMTQHWKCSGIRADSGAKILVLMEIGQKNQIDRGLGSPNPVLNSTNRFTNRHL